MSLSKYTQARLVVLRPSASAYQAIRAMQDNHVGAVLVHDGKHLRGVITDRDLALQLVTDELDAHETTLAEIDMAPTAVIGADESERDAAMLMRDRHVRRLPIVDGTDPVGMVTLDDLIAEQSVDRGLLAEIVRGQLSEASRLKPEGVLQPKRRAPTHPVGTQEAAQRHLARVQRAYRDLITRTMSLTGLDSPAQAEAALEVLVTGLCMRINADEARQLLAQLPCLLRERLTDIPFGPDRSMTRAVIAQRLAAKLGMSAERALSILHGVATALGANVSNGERDDLLSQLPADMRSLLSTMVGD